MANLPKPTNKSVPSDDIRDHVFAGGMLDKVMTSDELNYTDRLGVVHDTWAGIEEKSEDARRELLENGGVAVYKNEAELRASVPSDNHNLAVDSSTGNYYSWDKSVVAQQPETSSLIARMSTQPTDIQKSAINRLYYDLKQSGILSKLDALWLGINTSYSDSRLNLISGAYSLIPSDTIDYGPNGGWIFSGANWLDTGFNPAVNQGKYQRNSASIGVLVATDVNNGAFIGAYNGTAGTSISRAFNTLSARVNSSKLINGDYPITQTSLFSAVRNSESEIGIYVGGDLVVRDEALSEPVVSMNINIGRTSAISGWSTTATISAAYVGGGLSQDDVFNLNDALKRYIYGFRSSSLPGGAWVQTKFSLLSKDGVSQLADNNIDEKTKLLKNSIVAYPSYSDISRATVDSLDVRAVDESTGIVYEPRAVPSDIQSETIAVIARMASKPTSIQSVALNQLIYLLKSSGIWSRIDGLWLGVNTSYQDSLNNIVQNKFNLTSDKAPGWTTNRGWAFSYSALNYLDTGFNPSSAAGKLALEDASFGALLFPSTGMLGTGHIMGAFNGTSGIALAPRPSRGAISPMSVRLNQTAPLLLGDYPVANAVYGVSRLNGEISVYREGIPLGSAVQPATEIASTNVLLGCSQNTASYHMRDAELAAAWVGASLTASQMLTLTNAIRRYNDVFRGLASPSSKWWTPTDRKIYTRDEIVAIAGSGGGSTVLEPPASTATVFADISMSLGERGQTYRGGYIEIQPDSFIGGTEPATDGNTALWGFPQSLTLSEQSRLRSMVFPGNGYGIYYVRLPLGFAYRGFRNIDSATGLAKNIGERYAGQNVALKRLIANVVEAGGGLAPEYWCPAPYWMTNGKYAGTPTQLNRPWAGGAYSRSTSLDSIRDSDPAQYAAQINAMTDAMLDDFEYLHQNIGPVRMYALQNEPHHGDELYGTCLYGDHLYSDVLAALQPKIANSVALASYDGQQNVPLLHVSSGNDWSIGQTYISAHADKIWGYSHHNISAIAADADWLRSSEFINKRGDKSNVFVNETEYMYPQNSSNAWKCANNMLRDLHNLTFGGAEVVMPIIHVCKQLGESSSYTSNTDGYALMKCNLQREYGIDPGREGNSELLGFGSFGVNAWNYNAYRLIADNLPVGAIRVGGQPVISTAGIGISAFMSGGKLCLFIVNRNSGVAEISVTLSVTKTFAGRHYDLTHAGDRLSSKSGSSVTFVLPAYSGQCWAEV